MRLRIDPIIIIGITISVCCALIRGLRGGDATNSILIALAGSSVTLLLSIISKLDRHSSQTLELFDLKKIYEKSDFIKNAIKDLINDWQKLDQGGTHPLLKEVAERELTQCLNIIHQTSSGNSRTSGADAWPLFVMVDEAKTSLRFVSKVSRQWWESAMGENYLEKNIIKAKQGVQIIRIFVLDKIDVFFKELMIKMSEAGMKIFTLAETKELVHYCKGYVIADEKYVQITEYNDNGMSCAHRFSSDRDEVREALRNFDILIRNAREFKPED